MEILGKILGSQIKVKVMRLFILNTASFTVEEVASHSRVSVSNVRKEINNLLSIGFIKSKIVIVSGSRGSKKKVNNFYLNPDFEYLNSLRDLLVDPNNLIQEDMVKKFKLIGKIKLMIVSGVFIYESKSKVDLLIVCDKVKKNTLAQVIKALEAEIGKELDYVVFDTTEFKYRLDMYDKLICELIQSPHQKLIDTGTLSTYISKN